MTRPALTFPNQQADNTIVNELSPPETPPTAASTPCGVCHVTTVHDPRDTRIFAKECRSLARAGYDVHLLAPGATEGVVDGVHVHGLPAPPNRLVRMLLWPGLAMRRVLRLRPRLVHVHDPELLPVAWVLQRLGVTAIYDVHENVADDIAAKPYLGPFLRWTLSSAYRLVEALLTVGLPTVHVLPEIAARYRQPKVVVRNLPELPEAAPEQPEPARPPRLIYLGVIGTDRGALRMVDVLAELSRRGVDVELRLVGPIRQTGLRERIVARAREAGVAERCILTGPLPYAEAMAEVRRARLGLCLFEPTSNNQTSLPNKLLEYMAQGLPVVASDFPAWRRYVAEVGSGAMVDPLNVPAIAETIANLLADPDRLEAMARAGCEAVVERFNWPTEAKKLLAFYERLLGGESSVGGG